MSFSFVLSKKACRREPSAIRELAKILQKDKTILSLGAGTPNSSAVPLSAIKFEVRVGGSCFEDHEPQYPPEIVGLEGNEARLALSYSPTAGIAPLLRRLRAICIQEHKLNSAQSTEERLNLMVGTGSQSLLGKGLEALCDPGDSVIVEAATYPGTLALLQGIGVRTIAASCDGKGMLPSALRSICSSWPAAAANAWDPTSEAPAEKAAAPRVVYLVPNGGNPTGNTMPESRRREIYEACKELGLAIIEDDPYYWLRYPAPEEAGAGPADSTPGSAVADPPASGSGASSASGAEASGAAAGGATGPLTQLPPPIASFLQMDTDGRVLRLDSFSKIIAGGLRMGCAAGPRALIERMELDGQASDLHASGLSQAMLCATLRHWGAGNDARASGEESAGAASSVVSGDAVAEGAASAASGESRRTAHLGRFADHVRHVAGLYRSRCATFASLAREHLPADKVQLAVPEAGMFFWIKTTLEDTTALVKTAAEKSKVLLLPGHVFCPKNADGTPRKSPFIRASFSMLDAAAMEEALKRLGHCLREVPAAT